MTTRLEFNLRAALCRQLAKREPANRSLWMAEAEHLLRLSKEELQGEAEAKSAPARPVSARRIAFLTKPFSVQELMESLKRAGRHPNSGDTR